MNTTPLDLGKLRVRPLAERDSLTRLEDILVDPEAKPPAPWPTTCGDQIAQCASGSSRPAVAGPAVMLIYGAHLLRNGRRRSWTG